jgi:hypothetical protein
VVDQLRADYLQRFDRHWHRGFRTLLDKGLVFDNARYPYLGTVTCAGHSTIGTGTLPHTHGMISNTWWLRDERRLVGCTADNAAMDISYGRPVRLGNSAAHLMVPTLADELRMQKPGARVVAVSMKARSAVIAGRACGRCRGLVRRSRVVVGDLTRVRVGPGARRAGVRRQESLRKRPRTGVDAGGAGEQLREPRCGHRRAPPSGWNGLFPHPLNGRGRGGTVDQQFSDLWQSTPLADAYLERMATALVDSFSLGQRDATDFLGISFSVLDDVGHNFGPDSREIEDVLRQLDVTLGVLIDRLDARVGRGKYVLALSADHGVAPIAVAPRGGASPPTIFASASRKC